MSAQPWFDSVDFATAYPGEPLVPVGIVQESPLAAAAGLKNLSACVAFCGEERRGWHNSAADLAQSLLATEEVLLTSGPAAADKAWREQVGVREDQPAPVVTIREHIGTGYSRSDGYWSTRCKVPSLAGMSPTAAVLYLAAIGKLDRPVPLSYARTLLNPDFDFPDDLSKLAQVSAQNTLTLTGLIADEDHCLVYITPAELERIAGQNRFAAFGGKRQPVEYSCEVVSEGWRARDQPLFRGYPCEAVEENSKRPTDWEFDHDGTRLVRLRPAKEGTAIKTSLPVVEFAEILPDITALANDVRDNPTTILDEAARDAHWKRERPGVSAVARRLIEGVLVRFTPWPYPFRARTEAEQRLRAQDSADAVVALFDRLLDAPGPMRPDDLTAYFISMITKRRAEFAAWPEDLFGVWGFKMKTGDHNWINGSIWHEPGVKDNPADPTEWTGSRTLIENTRYRDRYRHRVHLRTGSLRCFIERDDT